MKKSVYLPILFIFLINGCAILKVTDQTVKTAGTAIETTGKVVEVVGKAVVTSGQTVSKIVEVGGQTAEAIANTPGAKEAIATQLSH